MSVGRKLERSSRGSDKGASGARMDTVTGLLVLGADTVAVSEMAMQDSALRSGLICSREYVEEN